MNENAYEPLSVATYVGPRREMTLTHEDRLWAARGIYGEGGPYPDDDVIRAYLWAIMHRCLLMPNTRCYGDMWRAFSQPINPRWQRDGEFCRVGGRYHGEDECSSARLARRQRICGMSWLQISQVIRDSVVAFTVGELPKPDVTLEHRARLSNWASYPGVEEKFPWGTDIGGEWFFEDKRLLPGYVEVKHASL